MPNRKHPAPNRNFLSDATERRLSPGATKLVVGKRQILFYLRGPEQSVFHIPMTRVKIGDYLGMSLETVSRGIAYLERRCLITTGARQGRMQAARPSRAVGCIARATRAFDRKLKAMRLLRGGDFLPTQVQHLAQAQKILQHDLQSLTLFGDQSLTGLFDRKVHVLGRGNGQRGR
jgi:hypothetical protein